MRKRVRDSNRYKVSDTGKVYSLVGGKEKEIKGWKDKTTGLVFVNMSIDGARVVVPRGALVLEHFAKNPHNKKRTLHKNGNNADDSIGNLLYASTRDVVIHTRDVKGMKGVKMSLSKAEELRALYATGEYTHVELAEVYGINQCTATQIISKRMWVIPEDNTRDPLVTFELAEQIRSEYTGIRGNQTYLADKYGIKQGMVSLIINNKRYIRKVA